MGISNSGKAGYAAQIGEVVRNSIMGSLLFFNNELRFYSKDNGKPMEI